MNNVPLEVLSKVMGYLDFPGRREAALVCRSWYEATLHPSFLKETKYTFDASILDNEKMFTNGKHDLAECLCKSPNLHIVCLDENFNAKYFLKLHKMGMQILGPHVEHLSLKNSNLLEGTLIEILQLCPNLKSLDLSGCNAMFMSGDAFAKNSVRSEAAKYCLKDITALSLASSRFMNDAILCRLFDLCPNLESLNLASNNVICNSLGISKKNSLTFLVVAQLVSLRSSQIKHIDLSRTSIVSDALSMLAITKYLDLDSIVLENCRELTDRGVVALVSHQPNITYLNLSGCLEIGDASVLAICEHLHKLKILNLRKCARITSASVKHLNKLKNLTELDVSECHEIDMAGLHNGLVEMEKLRVLRLKCCNLSGFNKSFFLPLTTSHLHNGMNESSHSSITASRDMMTSLPYHPSSFFLTYSLQHLDVGSSRFVDDNTLQAISTHLINLEVLKLAWCTSITDRGLLGITPERSHLINSTAATYDQKLAQFLSGGKYSNKHGQSGLIQIPGSEFCPEKLDVLESELLKSMEEKGIIRLEKLRHLTLANCKKLTPFSLLRIFKYKCGGFPYLSSLDLGMLTQAVNDDVIRAVAMSSRLRSLSLAFCTAISDEGIHHLSKQLRSLEILNISNCDSLTQSSIQTLSRHCVWLKELDLSMCKKVAAQSVDDLKDLIPSLLRVHTRFTGGASLDKTL